MAFLAMENSLFFVATSVRHIVCLWWLKLASHLMCSLASLSSNFPFSVCQTAASRWNRHRPRAAQDLCGQARQACP